MKRKNIKKDIYRKIKWLKIKYNQIKMFEIIKLEEDKQRIKKINEPTDIGIF